VSKYIGDKESSIHFDLNRAEMEDDRSSTSSKVFPGGDKAKASSRLSQSGVSARSGTTTKKKKAAGADGKSTKGGGTVSDTTSIKSGKSKTGGTKKKKKAASGSKKDDESV
jgi:hypothetical protein